MDKKQLKKLKRLSETQLIDKINCAHRKASEVELLINEPQREHMGWMAQDISTRQGCEAGCLLYFVKEYKKKGYEKWTRWLRKNFEGSESTASCYIQAYEYDSDTYKQEAKNKKHEQEYLDAVCERLVKLFGFSVRGMVTQDILMLYQEFDTFWPMLENKIGARAIKYFKNKDLNSYFNTLGKECAGTSV